MLCAVLSYLPMMAVQCVTKLDRAVLALNTSVWCVFRIRRVECDALTIFQFSWKGLGARLET